MNQKALIENNHEYWLQRAKTYSDVNKEELLGVQRVNWSRFLDREIREHFKINDSERKHIKILDIGAGPGFISIILSKLGYTVIAADFAENMLREAESNACEEGEKIIFKHENAMDLTFKDEMFDVVFSRNLTWNLPNPKKAYSEWLRVLKPDGCMMVFDANWYGYLQDETLKEAFIRDRLASEELGQGDFNVGKNFDVMEEIAKKLPLTGEKRPYWDEDLLTGFNVNEVSVINDVGDVLYSEKEKVNYRSTPMFMIKVRK